MNVLVLQETDWLIRGPHTQHHIFERLSKNPALKITVLDYDIDKIQKNKSLLMPKRYFLNINRTTNNSRVKVVRTAHLHISYFRRISSLFTNFMYILKIIRKHRIDIIIAYAITNGFIGLLIAKLFNIPYIYFYMDILHKLVPLRRIQAFARVVARISLKYADQILVHTELQRRYVINEGAPPKKVKVSPDGISLKNTIVNEKKFDLLKSKLNISDEDFIIFFMGYLYDFAGLKEIIDYYNRDVKNGKFNLKFLILGDGGIYKYLINYIKEIGADWVILPGRVPYFDITEYVQLAHLCLLSFELNEITKEILPIKIFEYMAMKKPVLSNKLPGVALEINRDHGVIYTKNQTELIKKIGFYINKKMELTKIGQKGYDLVKEKYIWPKIVKNFKKILIELIRKKRNY